SFLEVVTAQNITLAARRVAVDIHAQRLAATVQLAAIIGGGWDLEDPVIQSVLGEKGRFPGQGQNGGACCARVSQRGAAPTGRGGGSGGSEAELGRACAGACFARCSQRGRYFYGGG